MRARHTLRLRGALLGVLAAIAALAAFAAAPAPAEEALVPYIIGGAQSTISQFPWQVLVVGEIEPGLAVTCGGSILNASEVLTAAHCVDHEGTTTPYPPPTFEVLAGASEVLPFLETGTPPPASQLATVASLRTHPYYATLPETKDDVAVLTLAKPLEISAAADTQAIPLVGSGATPPPGTPLSISGYGKESGAPSAKPDGKLYASTLAAIANAACSALVGANSAVLMCAQGASSGTCQGDSGGPLTVGSPAAEVGIVDFGLKECPVGVPDAFTNLAAPEVRAFIEGSEAPPVAARPTSAPALKAPSLPVVDYSPMTCEPGTWSGAPAFNYTFETEAASPIVLQSGAANVYVPQSNVVGASIACIVEAGNPGGVTTLRVATSQPIVNDLAPPSASFSARPRCHLRSCTLAIRAADPNAVALSVRASVSYAVVTACPKHRRRHHSVCHKTKTLALAAAASSPGSYRASAGHLPYGEPLRFSVRASNAAALTQALAAVQSTTLHRPAARRKRR